MFLKILKTHRNAYVGASRPATLFKKRLWHRCSSLNFTKILRILFFLEYLRTTAFIHWILDQNTWQWKYNSNSPNKNMRMGSCIVSFLLLKTSLLQLKRLRSKPTSRLRENQNKENEICFEWNMSYQPSILTFVLESLNGSFWS